MLSRVAESVYWAARYIERAENTARFIDVNLQMSLDAPLAFSEQWEPLIAITGDLDFFRTTFGEPTRENVIEFLAFSRDNPNSILSCVSKARENARSIREVTSSETWEQINRFHLMVSDRSAVQRAIRDSYQFFTEVRLLSHLIAGVADNTMSHGLAWHFLQLGRLLERADNTSRLLDVKYFLLLPSVEDVGRAVDEMQWAILLRSATALEMYRKRHGRMSPENVVEFLLLDAEFPRAVLFCLLGAEQSLHAIPGAGPGNSHNEVGRRLGELLSELAYTQACDIIALGLHEFLKSLQSKLNAVGDAMAETFFALQPVSEAAIQGGRASGDILFGDKGQ